MTAPGAAAFIIANKQSDSPEAILTGEDGIDGFEQREEQLVAVLRGLAGTDTDVKVVFRQQVLATKVRCFSASWLAGELHMLRCVVHLLAVRAPPLTPERWAGTKAALRWSHQLERAMWSRKPSTLDVSCTLSTRSPSEVHRYDAETLEGWVVLVAGIWPSRSLNRCGSPSSASTSSSVHRSPTLASARPAGTSRSPVQP